MKNFNKETLNYLLIPLLIIMCWIIGHHLLSTRDWSNVDCKDDTNTTIAEITCRGLKTNDLFFFDGVKLILSPIWVPFVLIGKTI